MVLAGVTVVVLLYRYNKRKTEKGITAASPIAQQQLAALPCVKILLGILTIGAAGITEKRLDNQQN